MARNSRHLSKGERDKKKKKALQQQKCDSDDVRSSTRQAQVDPSGNAQAGAGPLLEKCVPDSLQSFAASRLLVGCVFTFAGGVVNCMFHHALGRFRPKWRLALLALLVVFVFSSVS